MTETSTPISSLSTSLGLVLSGGGARGAYQAGVIGALYEIQKDHSVSFAKIISGVSAGAINAGFLASNLDQPDLGTEVMRKTWQNLHAENIFRTDYSSVTRNAFKLIRGVSLGGVTESLRPQKVSLLNTEPLKELLDNVIPFDRIPKLIESGHLQALAMTSTDYSTSFGVTFFQAHPSVKAWTSTQRFGLSTQLSSEHIMASSAIPIFFPPVEVNRRFFGDGCLRNTAPLSPSIHLGAKKLIVVGVRKGASLEEFKKPGIAPSLGRVLSVLINAIFMDAVEIDLERLRIVNEAIKNLRQQGVKTHHASLSAIYLHPTRDLAKVAQSRAGDLPAIIRFLFKGLGTAEESAELLSYLLFEPSYCTTLYEMGYEDTLQRKSEILQFLEDDLID